MNENSPFGAVREGLGQGPGTARRQLQRGRLLHSLGQASPRRGGLGVLLAAAAVGGALVLLLRPAPPPPPPGAVGAGSTFSAPDGAAMTLTFSEASQVTLAAGGTGTLEALDDQHVDVRLEHGHLDAHVTKHTGRVWRYLAGPYQVRVVGTVLSVSWQPDTHWLEVSVDEGAVEVSGPGFDGPITVRRGEKVHRGGEQAQAAREPGSPKPEAEHEEKPVAEEPSPAPARTPPHAAPHSAAAPRPGETRVDVQAPPAAAPDWQQLLRAGDRKKALEAAEQAGVLTRPDILSSNELLRLADAARLEHHPSAETLLARCVERGGGEGGEAAFLLGKLQQDRGELAAAVGSFRDAQRLDPATYDEPASGRLIELLSQLKDPTVKDVAREYLRKHPGGPWAGPAQRVLETVK